MAVTCTETNNPSGCGHYHVTVGGVSLEIHESELGNLTPEEIEQLLRLAVRYKGVALANLLNRVVLGDEATNVKAYTLVAPGVAVARTNVGVTPQNLLPGASGQRMLVDFTGCTEFRLAMDANIVSGTWALRVVRSGDDEVLYQSPNLSTTGEQDLDTDWQPLPAGFDALAVVVLQVGSSASASATFRRCVLLVR